MPELRNCEGVKGGTLLVRVVGSVTAAMSALREGERAVTGAGDHGAWNVYVRDDGRYHCEFFRYLVTVNVETHSTKKAVREWLTLWVPRTAEPTP